MMVTGKWLSEHRVQEQSVIKETLVLKQSKTLTIIWVFIQDTVIPILAVLCQAAACL